MKTRALVALGLAAVLFAPAAYTFAASPSPDPSKTPSAHSSTARASRPALPPPDAKTVQAVRAAEPIVLDGRLDEAVWKTTPPATGFTQTDPEDGSPATEPTEVWVAYDDHALYVAAFCHDSDPAKIRKRLGRRDAQTDSDWFMVAVDPYYDKRSGYAFYANPAGSITDAALSNDVIRTTPGTASGRTRPRSTASGWTIEMKHPVQPDPLPEEGRIRLGRQLHADDQAQEREVGLRLGPEERNGLRLALRPPRGPARHQPGRPGRVHALRRGPDPVPPGRGRQPLRDRPSGPRQRRLRPQGRPQEQPDARRHGQPGLRPGRGRPRRPQPLGLRDLLRGEAAVLHRGRVALQQLRPRRRLHQRQHQLAAADSSFTAAASAASRRATSPPTATPACPTGRRSSARPSSPASSAAAGTSVSSTR